MPRSMIQVGVIIDDLIVLEKVARSSQQAGSVISSTLGDERMTRADAAYANARLLSNSDKAFPNEVGARFWGVELDGLRGF